MKCLGACMEIPQKFHFTVWITESGLDSSVIQPCGVDTGVSSLCQPHAGDTKASPENVAGACVFMHVCVCARGGWGTHQPAAICSFQGSQIADNRLSKQSRSSGSLFGSAVNHLHLCQIWLYLWPLFAGGRPINTKRLTKTPPMLSVHTCSKI